MKRPFLNRPQLMALVFAEGFAGVVIPLDYCGMMKSGVRHANRQPTGSSEKLNTTHRETSLIAELQSFGILELALPNCQHFPSLALERPSYSYRPVSCFPPA